MAHVCVVYLKQAELTSLGLCIASESWQLRDTLCATTIIGYKQRVSDVVSLLCGCCSWVVLFVQQECINHAHYGQMGTTRTVLGDDPLVDRLCICLR